MVEDSSKAITKSAQNHRNNSKRFPILDISNDYEHNAPDGKLTMPTKTVSNWWRCYASFHFVWFGLLAFSHLNETTDTVESNAKIFLRPTKRHPKIECWTLTNKSYLVKWYQSAEHARNSNSISFLQWSDSMRHLELQMILFLNWKNGFGHWKRHFMLIEPIDVEKESLKGKPHLSADGAQFIENIRHIMNHNSICMFAKSSKKFSSAKKNVEGQTLATCSVRMCVCVLYIHTHCYQILAGKMVKSSREFVSTYFHRSHSLSVLCLKFTQNSTKCSIFFRFCLYNLNWIRQ